MNAFELLSDDHDKVAGLLERLEETTERAVKTRESLFAKLNDDLTLHARIEEAEFYPVLRDRDKTEAITLKAYEAHAVIKNLLNELSGLSVESPEWTAKLKVLKDAVEQHVADEEGEMFKLARQELTKKEIDALGEQIATARRTPEEVGLPANGQRAAVRVTAAASSEKNQPVRSSFTVSGAFCSSCRTFVGNLFSSVCGPVQYGQN